MQQGGLARTRRADDGRELARAHAEAHAAQRLYRRLRLVDLRHRVDFQHRRRAAISDGRPRRGEAMAGRSDTVDAHMFGTTTCWAAATPLPVTCTTPAPASHR